MLPDRRFSNMVVATAERRRSTVDGGREGEGSKGVRLMGSL